MRIVAYLVLGAMSMYAGIAHADEGWAQRCAVLFEAAKAELSAKDPMFAAGALALERPPGDATSATGDPLRRPLVSYRLGSVGHAPVYAATVSDAASGEPTRGWEDIPNKAYSGFDVRFKRVARGRLALVAARDEEPRKDGFVRRFRQAADACLALP